MNERAEFRISDRLLAKKRRAPFITIIYVAVFSLILSFTSEDGGFSWGHFIAVFCVTYLIAGGCNYAEYRKFYKYSQQHKISVSERGLFSIEGDTESLLKWEKVNDVIVKQGKNGIKKLTLSTNLTGKVDLSRYENLDQLYTLVNSYVKNSTHGI